MRGVGYDATILTDSGPGRVRKAPSARAATIVRHRPTGNFTAVPNSILEDDRLSVEAKGLLCYLLSRPPNWQPRHDQLQRKLRIGRKLLKRCFGEIIDAGYGVRDEKQGRDGCNQFTTLNYVIRDIPERTLPDAPKPQRPKPLRLRDTGNNKEGIKTDSNNPFPKSLPTQQEEVKQALQGDYTEFGKRALAAGQYPVYLGSKPYQAWLSLRGEDGMPGFVDRVTIDGKTQNVVWMPSLRPPRGATHEPEEGGGWSNL